MMNHAIRKDIEERDRMAGLIEEAINALKEILRFDNELCEANLCGPNCLSVTERPQLSRQMRQLEELKAGYMKARKWEE